MSISGPSPRPFFLNPPPTKGSISSGLESIRSGISSLVQKSGLGSIKDALQMLGKPGTFSAESIRKFGSQTIAKFGHAHPPHHFFKQLASAKGMPFGKFQPREMARKLADPSLKMEEGLKGLTANFQKSIDSIQKRIQTVQGDPMPLVQSVIRESYQDNVKDLKYYAEKVRSYNETKKNIREKLQETKEPEELISPTAKNEIQKLEDQLSSVGDDAQLANVDMQNILQKQQQTMQMMSNMAKMTNDTAMQIIRRLGG